MYTKLLRIRYNEKEFDVFCDSDDRKEFLEIRNGEYFYPTLDDLVRLNLIYNSECNILYSKKFNFDGNKIKNIVINTTYLISTIVLVTSVYKYTKDINNTYKPSIATTTLYLTHNDYLDEYSLEEVTFDDVRKTLQRRKDIPLDYYNYIDEYISRLEKKLPDVDLRIFNQNLKDFKLLLDSNENVTDNEIAYYNINENTIVLPILNDNIETIFYHELTHMLNSTQKYYPYSNCYVKRCFFARNGYGVSINEGNTELITNYLLDDTTITFDEYLDRDDVNFFGYNLAIAPCCFKLFKLIRDDYSIYDYLDGSIYDYRKELVKYGLDDVVSVLDATCSSNNNNVEIVDYGEVYSCISRINEELEKKKEIYIR